MEIDELTLYWLAGLLEGEGSFCAAPPSKSAKPYIYVSMTDEDVIAKVAAIFDVKYHLSRPKQGRDKNWRPIFAVRLTGKRAVELMTMLKPMMGERRQAQIDKAVATYRDEKHRALTPEQMEELRHRSQNGESVLELAKEYGISKSLAYYIKGGYTYKRV